MGSDAKVKKVKVVWDNRENKFNSDYHKPHFMVVFEGDSEEAPDRLKINCTGKDDDKELYEQYGLWIKANGKGKQFLFVIETGTLEKDGEEIAWSAIRGIKSLDGNDVLDGQPRIEPGGGADHKASAASAAKTASKPPSSTAAPKTSSVAASPVGWVSGVCTPDSEAFWAEKAMVERLGITRGAAFNGAVQFLAASGAQFVQYDEQGFLQIKHEDIATAVKAVSDTLVKVLRGAQLSDRMDHFMGMLERCASVEEGSMLVAKAARELPLEAAATFKGIAHNAFSKKKEGA